MAGVFAKKSEVSSPAGIIDYYRKLGFFSQQSNEQVLWAYREEWDKEPPASGPWDDVFLLGYDKATAWTGDPEADVCDHNQVYISTLKEWAGITKGVFSPTEIEEKWHSETGPIDVSFLLNGERHTLHPEYQDDWIDLEVLLQLNRILEPSGKRFNCAVDGNFCLLLFLSRETEQRLRKERAFPFALPE
jgi:hypothetical protein